MKYFTYVDNKTGSTYFREVEIKNSKEFVGIFELTTEQTKYFRFNGYGIEKDNIRYTAYQRSNLVPYKELLNTIVVDKYNVSIDALKKGYPSEETLGWDIKSIQAKLWLESTDKQALIDSKSVLILMNESDGTIEGITNLAVRIRANSEIYQTVYGKNTKHKNKLLADIKVSTTIQELSIIEGSIKYD